MARYIYKHRRGSAEQWATANTEIPLEGEIVIELDNENSLHKLKIGDGIHTYAELAYLKAGDEIVSQVLPRIVTVTLHADQWACETDPNLGYYSQALTLEGITNHSRLDLQPNVDMLAEFKKLGIMFVTENKGGNIVVRSIGEIPTKDYTMQATIVETEIKIEEEKIVGIPVGASYAHPETHPASMITGLEDRFYTETEIDNKLNDKAEKFIVTPKIIFDTTVNPVVGNMGISYSELATFSNGAKLVNNSVLEPRTIDYIDGAETTVVWNSQISTSQWQVSEIELDEDVTMTVVDSGSNVSEFVSLLNGATVDCEYNYNEIQTIKENLTSSLPKVTDTDNGKFLVVENGVWTAKEIALADDMEV